MHDEISRGKMEPMINDHDLLVGLLRKPIDDAEVVKLLGSMRLSLKRSAFYGFIELKTEGFSLMFKEAPWVIPQSEIINPKKLYVSCFHFHRQGHDGYSEFRGQLPKGVTFQDDELGIIRKLGSPSATGGGELIPLLKKPIPRWIQYVSTISSYFQLDGSGFLEMVSVSTKDLKSS